jgi:branched-chain amino acid aminotransferase
VATRIYIDGTISGPEDAKISVFDRGFLYGDSVYEVMRTSGGHLVDFERHLVRLQKSADSLALATPDVDEVREAIARTLSSSANTESYLRIVVTRGSGEVGLDTALAGRPTLIVIAKPLVLPAQDAQDLYERGIGVRLVDVQRTSAKAVDPSVKSGNYLNNILALAEARGRGDDEAIMCDQGGSIAEGSSSNVFWVSDGVLHTPSLAVGLLAGITRGRVLELAKDAGIAAREGSFAADELRGASEAFITRLTGALIAGYAEFLDQQSRP